MFWRSRTRQIPEDIRGYLMAADGWGALFQGDTASGLRRLRAGLDQAAAPGRRKTAASFDSSWHWHWRRGLKRGRRVSPACATGSTSSHCSFRWQPWHSAARTKPRGSRTPRRLRIENSSGIWNRAEPELQSRVTDARRALEELTQERPGSR